MKTRRYICIKHTTEEDMGHLFAVFGEVTVDRRVSIHRTIWDTFDWRFHQAGMLLSQESIEEGTRAILEYYAETPPDSIIFNGRVPRYAREFPDSPHGQLIKSVLGERALLPIVRLRFDATLFTLRVTKGSVRLRIVLEQRVQCMKPGQRSRQDLPDRLTIFFQDKGQSLIDEIDANIREQLSGKATDRLTLYQNCLETIGRSPGDYSSALRLSIGPSLPAINAVVMLYRELLIRIEQNLDGTIHNIDPEFLHDFRVAFRRTRAGLSQLVGIIPDHLMQPFKEQFAHFGRITGPARDIDVFVLTVDSYLSSIDPPIAERLVSFTEHLAMMQREAHHYVSEALRSHEFSAFLAAWRSFLGNIEHVKELPANACEPICILSNKWIAKACKRVLKRGGSPFDTISNHHIHRLRIECKKLRYLLEFFRSIHAEEKIGPLIKTLKSLQDNLGNYHDIIVQSQTIEAIAESMMKMGRASADTILALGILQGSILRERKVWREKGKASYTVFSHEGKKVIEELNAKKNK